ncbi:MAG TPA: hypothetical protein VG520_05550 [Candidatus Dormibacteraeota bacterium]|nr:hypothetical protein [Candidatus Dormibacteraeota bacterium]
MRLAAARFAAGRVAVVRFAVVAFTVLRLAVDGFAVDRFAVARLAVVGFAEPRLLAEPALSLRNVWPSLTRSATVSAWARILVAISPRRPCAASIFCNRFRRDCVGSLFGIKIPPAIEACTRGRAAHAT